MNIYVASDLNDRNEVIMKFSCGGRVEADVVLLAKVSIIVQVRTVEVK